MNSPFRINAPCKINLHLSVGKRRSDGFHSLESIFALLVFGDTLEFSPGGGALGRTALKMTAEGPFRELCRADSAAAPIPPEKNLVYRAVELFRVRGAFYGDLEITLVKRVPPGSGLGGGSSDAAAALLALNSLAGEALAFEELLALGEELGSDVPFFLYREGAAWVSGRGETVLPIKAPPPLPVLLAFPGFSSNTAEAFALLDRSRSRAPAADLPGLPAAGSEALIAALETGPAQWPYRNDFLPVFLARREYGGRCRAVLQSLELSGAAFTGLSGSGSACFGVFSSEEDAEKARISLSGGLTCFKQTKFFQNGKF